MRFAHTPAPSSYALRAYVRRASSPDKSCAESPKKHFAYKKGETFSLAFGNANDTLTIITPFSLQTVNFTLIAFNRSFKVTTFVWIKRVSELLAIMTIVSLKFVNLTVKGHTIVVWGCHGALIMTMTMVLVRVMRRHRGRRRRRR